MKKIAAAVVDKLFTLAIVYLCIGAVVAVELTDQGIEWGDGEALAYAVVNWPTILTSATIVDEDSLADAIAERLRRDQARCRTTRSL